MGLNKSSRLWSSGCRGSWFLDCKKSKFSGCNKVHNETELKSKLVVFDLVPISCSHFVKDCNFIFISKTNASTCCQAMYILVKYHSYHPPTNTCYSTNDFPWHHRCHVWLLPHAILNVLMLCLCCRHLNNYRGTIEVNSINTSRFLSYKETAFPCWSTLP